MSSKGSLQNEHMFKGFSILYSNKPAINVPLKKGQEINSYKYKIIILIISIFSNNKKLKKINTLYIM